MRFALVCLAVFGLFGIGYAEDLATKLENAGKPGSPEYREYLRKKAERVKLLAPIKAELQVCLADEAKDPTNALCAIEILSIAMPELGVQEEELHQLRTRSKEIREVVSEFVKPLDTQLAQYVATPYSSVPAANMPTENWIFGLFVKRANYSSYTAGDLFYASRGVDWASAMPYQDRRGSSREEAVRQVSTLLAVLREHQPTRDDPPYCSAVWENKVLHAIYLAKRWVMTPAEAGINEMEYKEWQQNAEAVAIRQAKALRAELKKPKPEWLLICFAEDHKWELLFEIAPQKLGITPRQVEGLMREAKRAWQR